MSQLDYLSRSQSKRKSIAEKCEELESYLSSFGSQKYNQVRRNLNDNYLPEEVPCRDDEKQIIKQFITNAIYHGHTSEVLFIAGSPGIGKTLCVKEVMGKLENTTKKMNKKDVVFLYINAMKLKNPKNIFNYILTELNEKTGHKEQNKKFSHIDHNKANIILDEYFTRGYAKELSHLKGRLINKLLVIDEIDCLDTEDHQYIYTIVEWIQRKTSRLSIIGISNQVDLPEQYSPKIASRFGNKRLIFKQYNRQQIGEIIKRRVDSCSGLLSIEALEFVCNKLGTIHTDIRKCLRIMREAVNRHTRMEKNYHDNDKITVANIPIQTIKQVIADEYEDSFTQAFDAFPHLWKVTLAYIANYYRNESQPMAFSELLHEMRSVFTRENQLNSVLYDLRDQGIVSLTWTAMKRDLRKNQLFRINKQCEQAFITLMIQVEKVLYCVDNIEREDQKVAIFDRIRNRK